MGQLFTSSLTFLSFSCTYDSHKHSFLASFEFTAILKGWGDVNKLGVKQEGENPVKTTSLASSELHPHHGTT